MKFQGKNFLPRAALTAALTMNLGLSQSALAESGSGDMEVSAGLSQALKVECTQALDFGTTSVIAGSRTGDAAVITVPTSGSASLDSGVDGNEISVGTVAPGSCTVTGSSANGGDFGVTVTAPTMTDSGGAALSGLSISSFTIADKSIKNGGATILIGGDLTIPDSLSATNGDFTTYSGTATVTVDDPNT
jgi:hypothetical protein